MKPRSHPLVPFATAARCLATAVLILMAWGCQPASQPCPDCDASLGAASTDPTVTIVTIDEGCLVSNMSPVISKSGNGGIQWHNAGTSAIKITFIGAPFGIDLQPGAYSSVFRLSDSATIGQKYEYVRTGTGCPPDPPSFEVGP